MSQQLVKKDSDGRYSNVMPNSWIEAIKDKSTGQTLVEILQGFNMYFLPYNGNTSATRCLVPKILRKKGLWITYVKYDGNVYTEWYADNKIDDKSWGDNSNWRIGNNTLVGDITISANGNWIINGTETEFKAAGEKGNTPLLRVYDNKLQVSYDLGDTYIDVTNNPVYTKFRWSYTTGDTQNNIVGRLQSSVDEGKTWTNMSNDFTNNLHIKKYIGVNEPLPTSGIAEGTIYAKGPTYAVEDTSNSNPIYRLWVYAWKGNTLAWQDNGEFTSITAGIVQETGSNENAVMSQKATSEAIHSVLYDVSAHNDDAVFESLKALLSSSDLNTLIPTSARHGGMSIRFVQSSDNKYVQYRLMANTFSNTESDWQGVDSEPIDGSKNLVESGGVQKFQYIYNNTPNTAFADKYTARLAVPVSYRRFGLVITYLLADGWVIERNDYRGTGHIYDDTIWPREDMLDIHSWITLSEKEGFNTTAAFLGYYRYQGTATGEANPKMITPLKTCFSGKKLKVKVNSGNYANLYLQVITTDDSRNTTLLTSDNFEYISQEEIKYASVGVRIDAPTDTYDIEFFSSVAYLTEKNSEHIGLLEAEVSTINDKVDDVIDKVLADNSTIENIPVTIHKENNLNGYWLSGNGGAWAQDDGRKSTDKIDVSEGETYLVTTNIGGSTLIAYLAQWNGSTWVGVATGFTGGSGNAVDKEYVVPAGVTKIALCSYNSAEPVLKKKVIEKVFAAYTKEESDSKYAPKITGRYGVKWSISDTDDLGQRCFDAIGKIANIGIGNTDGYSDFDNIYPWSDIKRCNIKVNANGAKIVTFEGEPGFSLSGANGNVFVRIPKFCVEKYEEGGYAYRVVSRNQGFVHPAFIEDGKEIDEIFVATFEGVISYGKLGSVSGVIPTSNEKAEVFLSAANANGAGFSLYDLRCIDAIWTLYAVEYSSRNTNQYLGYGVADMRQPDKGASGGRFDIKEVATNTNSVKVSLLSASYKYYLPLGSNITVCKGTQSNILTQAKITNITDGADYTQFTFNGDPIDVDTDCFIGSAACTTNFCETCGASKKLSWHTGRADFISGSEKQNPMRYRWIENIVGSLWAFTPDITLQDLQLYVCDNIKDYEFGKYVSPYRPVGEIMTEQTSNGEKNDNAGGNYWIHSLLDDIFAKGITLGKSYDKSLTSRKAFGAYYYTRSGTRINVNGGGFDHDVRCNMLTNRMWISTEDKWYLYGARLIFKNI